MILTAIPSWMNRKDNRYKISELPGSPKLIPLDDVRSLYQDASPLMKLFILLALNCGCGQGEIGKIEKGEYDPAQGRITRRRSKTERHKNAPVVSYRLWNRTQKLLEEQLEIQKTVTPQKGYENYLLWNDKGVPFWYESNKGGKYNKNDYITTMFQKLLIDMREEDKNFPTYTFYQFRKTGASVIYNNKEFHFLSSLWLGHSPKTTAERHYQRPDVDILDECLIWMEQHLFGNMPN
jgi:Phage integrase family.